MARALTKAGRHPEAVKAFSQLSEEALEKHPAALLPLGESALATGDAAAAAAAFEKALHAHASPEVTRDFVPVDGKSTAVSIVFANHWSVRERTRATFTSQLPCLLEFGCVLLSRKGFMKLMDRHGGISAVGDLQVQVEAVAAMCRLQVLRKDVPSAVTHLRQELPTLLERKAPSASVQKLLLMVSAAVAVDGNESELKELRQLCAGYSVLTDDIGGAEFAAAQVQVEAKAARQKGNRGMVCLFTAFRELSSLLVCWSHDAYKQWRA